MQRFDIDVDPNFEIHTSYHTDFFLLRASVLVNGENTEIRSIKQGRYEGPALTWHSVSITLSSISRTVSPVLVQYGIYHVDTFYYEQSPLFRVVFSSESCLRNFILVMGEVKAALEPKLQSLLLNHLKSVLESAHPLTVEVQADLFLVSPNQQMAKGADVKLVTAENCSTLVTCWKDSKLFDFESLYRKDGVYPVIK